MKFVHAADIHLDSLSSGLRSFYGMESFSISEAIQNAFRALIDLALEQKVDFILIAGDLFDSNWKDYSLGLFFIEQIKRIECPIIYIRGNHDSENRLLKKLPYPDHLIELSSDKPGTYILESLRVALHGQSYAEYHTRTDLSKNYPNYLPGYFNIGLLHTSGDVKLGLSPYSPYETKILQSKKYDYWALGHLHDFDVISKNPYVVYSGCIQGRHINERGAKGCCIVEVKDHSILNLNFHSLSEVLFEKCELDVSSAKTKNELKNNLFTKIDELIAFQSNKNIRFILRITLLGTKYLRSLSHDLEHLEHEFYCWLQDRYPEQVMLERIINKMIPPLSEAKRSEDTEAIKQLLTMIETAYDKKDAEAHFNEVLEIILDKLPQELKRSEYRGLLEDSKLNLLDQIKQCVYERLSEDEV